MASPSPLISGEESSWGLFPVEPPVHILCHMRHRLPDPRCNSRRPSSAISQFLGKESMDLVIRYTTHRYIIILFFKGHPGSLTWLAGIILHTSKIEYNVFALVSWHLKWLKYDLILKGNHWWWSKGLVTTQVQTSQLSCHVFCFVSRALAFYHLGKI